MGNSEFRDFGFMVLGFGVLGFRVNRSTALGARIPKNGFWRLKGSTGDA